MIPKVRSQAVPLREDTFIYRLRRDLVRNKELYLIALPVIAFYLVFHYGPMYGASIAFRDYTPAKGISAGEWIGFKHFLDFFGAYTFERLLRNTVVISLSTLVFGFPAPIIIALMINELRSKYFSRIVQTITYLPHFISMVVFCGMIVQFTKDTGAVTTFLSWFGFPKVTMLNKPELFVPVYVTSTIWKEVGWNSIIFLAALAGIDQQLYEAAKIDGAGRLKQAIHVTIPGIIPVIIIMLILRLGRILGVGFEGIILLYNPITYETADVLSSYVYRKGLQDYSWSFSTAVGLFNSVVNFVFVVVSNWISRKTSETSLW